MEPRRRYPLIAALLNVVLPGSGHFYVGRARRFFLPLFAVVSVYLALGWLGWLSTFLGFVAAFGLFAAFFVCSIVDAFSLARRANPYVPKWYNRWYVYTPWILILVCVSVAWPASRTHLFGYASYRVPGVAMVPTITNGDYILVDARAYRQATPALGEVVVVRVPETGIEYVRRVAKQLPSGKVEFKTDNSESMRTGPGLRALPTSTIVGRVTYV